MLGFIRQKKVIVAILTLGVAAIAALGFQTGAIDVEVLANMLIALLGPEP